MKHDGIGDILSEAGQVGDRQAQFPFSEVPFHYDVVGDGRTVVVVGDTEGCKEFNHRQGDNELGFHGTCGIVSCEDVLRQFGVDVTESDVVRHAYTKGLCAVTDDPATSGGTTLNDQVRILSDADVPAHAETGAGITDLVDWVRGGHGTILAVNAGELWNDADSFGTGEANHAIVVTGLAIDPQSRGITGFYINDSGRGYPGDSGRFVDLETLREAWVNSGGLAVVTDITKASPGEAHG